MPSLKTIALSIAITSSVAAPATAQQAYHRGGGASAIVYAQPDFRGQSLRITGPVDHLNRYRFNDKASSIRITGGAWEVCVDPNFRGRCEVLTYREDSLNEFRLNNKITSIRPVSHQSDRWGRDDRYDRGGRYHDRDNRYGGGYGRNAPVMLFSDPNFRGNALPVDGAIPHLNPLRFNDKVSSIAVRGGSWEVCTDPNFRGRCTVITGSIESTSYYKLNDNITSIRPARGGYGGRW